MPNSSAATANTKSVWLSGRMRLTVPSPGPRPNQPPLLEGFERLVDVEGVAGRRIEKTLDALRHIGHQHVGGREAERGHAAEPDHPDDAHAGQEEQRAPDQRDQHGLAEVGLQHQTGHRDEQQPERHGVGRHFRPLRGFSEQPGNQDHEGGLEEFRRLDVDAEQDDPAPRALDLGAEVQRAEQPSARSPRRRSARAGGCSGAAGTRSPSRTASAGIR